MSKVKVLVGGGEETFEMLTSKVDPLDFQVDPLLYMSEGDTYIECDSRDLGMLVPWLVYRGFVATFTGVRDEQEDAPSSGD